MFSTRLSVDQYAEDSRRELCLVKVWSVQSLRVELDLHADNGTPITLFSVAHN